MSSSASPQPRSHRRMLMAQAAAALVVVLFVGLFERRRFLELPEGASPLNWLFDVNVDTTPFLPWLLILPWVWRWRAGGRGVDWRERWFGGRSLGRAWVLCAIVAATSLTVSISIARWHVQGGEGPPIGELPPAYHDEYSYLLQAKTFMAGRVSFPSHPEVPRLFDQMHVFNEGRFASRYFPGTGAWLAPFVALGRPYWGYWLAGALCASLVCFTGRELADNLTGFVAGLATAAAPGVGIFSNLLLAHHPTLLGLCVFLLAFVRLVRTRGTTDGVLAGLGLTFAMLCRPMTAAGFGLPFGLWLLYRTLRPGVPVTLWSRVRPAVAVGLPIVAGFVGLGFYNAAITGRALTTPYQVYTDIYTPRHVYGFNNVRRGEQRLGPRVIKAYDEWPENLTPSLAAENVRNRLVASAQWTLGIVPLLAAVLVVACGGMGSDRRWWFVPAAILSMHAAHVPYWYDGIMHWHYVFETCVLWSLLFAAATGRLFDAWRDAGRRWMPAWWGGFAATGVLASLFAFPPFWSTSRLEVELEQLAFARTRYAAFNQMVESAIPERPVLVLIEGDPADRSMDYVVNAPPLDGGLPDSGPFEAQVLRGRWPVKGLTLKDVGEVFPERAIYVFDVRAQVLERVRGSGRAGG